MGCDIHSFVEERHDGVWCISDRIYESDRRVGYADIFDGDEYKACCSPVDDRNYDLFGFLVRHVRGAGPTCASLLGDSQLPRGVPNDASPEVLKEWASWLGDGHTASWLTLRELVAGFMAANLRDCADGYRDQLQFGLKQMKARAKEAGLSYDNMRLVFWFDN